MTKALTARIALTAVAMSSLATIGARDATAETVAVRGGHQLDQDGTGSWSDFPCLFPRTGRCQFNLRQGAMTGTPIADGTYTITIDDDGAANPDTCVPATVAGLFGPREPDQSIAVRGQGQVCPDGAGGFTFAGTYTLAGGSGRYRAAKGSGDLHTTMGADRSSTLAMNGTVRGIR